MNANETQYTTENKKKIPIFFIYPHSITNYYEIFSETLLRDGEVKPHKLYSIFIESLVD